MDSNLDILKVLEDPVEFQNDYSNFDRKFNVGSGSASRDSAGLTTSTELAAFYIFKILYPIDRLLSLPISWKSIKQFQDKINKKKLSCHYIIITYALIYAYNIVENYNFDWLDT